MREQQKTAIDVAKSYQAEFLVEEYPTYGVDRLILEYRDGLENRRHYPYGKSNGAHHMPIGLRELYEARSDDIIREKRARQSENDAAYGYGSSLNERELEDPLHLIFKIWKQNYLLPRTHQASPEQEAEAFEMLHEYSQDKMAKGISTTRSLSTLSAHNTAKLLLWDTHLVPGIWGSYAETIIVPPNVTLDGDPGHCTIFDLNQMSLRPTSSPVLSQAAINQLVMKGTLTQPGEVARRQSGHLLG